LLPASALAAEIRLIWAGTLMTSADQQVSQRQTIVIEGAEMVAVESGYLPVDNYPNDQASVIDLRDAHVLPGLMDMHVHLTLSSFSSEFSKLSDSDIALMAAENAQKTLMAGFTTVRDLGSFRAEPIIALSQASERGTLASPRIYTAGQSISATAGHGDVRGLREDVASLMLSDSICDGADDCRRAVRSQYKLGATTIKMHATGGGADPNGRRESAPEMFDDEMLAVVETGHALGLRVAAHAHGTQGINAALRAGVDSIEHGSWITDESIELFLESGTYLVPTAYLQDYFLSRSDIPAASHEQRRIRVAQIHPMLTRAINEGVHITMGSDAGIMPHGDNALEIAKYVELGMSQSEAIRSATLTAAEMMGVGSQLGSIEVGKFADIIAVAGDPLEDISTLQAVIFVMRAGEVVKNEL